MFLKFGVKNSIFTQKWRHVCQTEENRHVDELLSLRTTTSIALGSYDQRKSTPSISLGSSAIME